MPGNLWLPFYMRALMALALLASLAGCRPAWQGTLIRPDGSATLVDRQVLKDLEEFASEAADVSAADAFAEIEDRKGVPLERLLVQAGHGSVERLAVVGADGTRHEFNWAAVADRAWWLDDGQIWVDGQELSATSGRVEVKPSPLLAQVWAGITDIAPTAAAALGLPAPAQATGQPLPVLLAGAGSPLARAGSGNPAQASATGHVLLLFLDGFGYVRYTEALRDGLIPNLAALSEPLVGLTTYPPATSVATASLLTGAPPQVHGANQRSIRKTETETLFDVAAAAGKRVVAVEGSNLSFNLRNAEVQLSGDMDGNGSTDDNVLSNALDVLVNQGMPDLLFVHFHGIDDDGHTYGPGAPQEEETIRAVDAAVGQILAAIPSGTLVLIFADHGMHLVHEQERLGNHGHLIERDMFIPVFITVR